MPNHPVLEKDLVPRRLKSLWKEVENSGMSQEEFQQTEAELIDAYRRIWTEALTGQPDGDLKASLCRELADLEEIDDLAAVEERCRRGVTAMREEWDEKVAEEDDASVIAYYDESENYAYELMWWHTLEEDPSPLAYVSALHLALKSNSSDALDFGAGVGSGAVLFARHGISVTCGDVSSKLLDFSQRRLERDQIEADYLDLKDQSLPQNAYDFIMAMDVLEHIAAPEKTVEILTRSLRPGGILFGRFASEIDEERPSHIARDFKPTFDFLERNGFNECFRDEWLWGHQAFQKPGP